HRLHIKSSSEVQNKEGIVLCQTCRFVCESDVGRGEKPALWDFCKTGAAASRQRAALFNLQEKCGRLPTAATMTGSFHRSHSGTLEWLVRRSISRVASPADRTRKNSHSGSFSKIQR